MNIYVMKLMVLCALVAAVGVVLAAPQNAQDVQLLRYDSKNDGLGTYSFAYDQSDGSSRNEEGELKKAGTENEFVAVKGSYMWIGPDGLTYGTDYIADENGYQPMMQQHPSGTLPLSVLAALLDS